MQITLTQNQGSPIDLAPEPAGAAATQTKIVSPSTPVSTPVSLAENSNPVSAPAPQPIQRTDVTLHQDSNGRAYYLVSDTRSGQEIIEVPPEAVRAVGQGCQ